MVQNEYINSQKINKDDIVSHKSKAYYWSKYEVDRFGHRTPDVKSMMHDENAGVLSDGNEDKEVAHQDVVLQLENPSEIFKHVYYSAKRWKLCWVNPPLRSEGGRMRDHKIYLVFTF